MACHDIITAKLLHALIKIAELDVSVAVDAWIRSPALFIRLNKSLHDFLFKFIFEVEDIKRNAKPPAYTFRILNIGKTAALRLL